MPFRDVHAAVSAEGYEGDALAELLAAYDEDESLSAAALAEAVSSSDAAAAALADAESAHTAEVQRLKAVNYDLLTQVPASDADTTTETVETDDGAIETFDDLFSELETDES